MVQLMNCEFTNPFASRLVIVLLSLLIAPPTPLQAEPPVRHRAVDVFSLHDGTRLLGVSLTPTQADSQSVLLNAKWLQQEYPVLFQSLTAQAAERPAEQTDLADRIRQHIAELRAQKPDQIERVGYLQERLIDIEAQNKTKAKATQQTSLDLVVVELPASVIRRQLLQKPEIRNMGQLALLNGIPDVETISAADVNSALVAHAANSELRMSLPTSADEPSEREWLRLLIASERLFGESCRLIHFSGRYVSADNQAAAFQQLVPDMLQGQIQKQLSALLGQPADKPQKAHKPQVADRGTSLDPAAALLAGKFRLVEVSRLDFDPASGTARVTIELYFRRDQADDFRLFCSVAGNASTTDISREQLQRINDDPRVRQITQLFGSLGAGSAELNTALSMGAVVEVAQNKATQALAAQFSNVSVDAGHGSLTILRVKLTEIPASE